jgi:hypothetical protein
MAVSPYDSVGALGGLFAPAWLYGDEVSKAAVEAWNAKNLKKAPDPFTGNFGAMSDPANAQRDAITNALISGRDPFGGGGGRRRGGVGGYSPARQLVTQRAGRRRRHQDAPARRWGTCRGTQIRGASGARGVAQGGQPGGTVTSAAIGDVPGFEQG